MKPFFHLLDNPYYMTGAVFTKQMTNFWTAFWSVLLFFRGEPMPQTAFISLTNYLSQETVGAAFFALSVFQMVWLALGWEPLKYGMVGYLFLFAWWVGIFFLVALTPPIVPLTLTAPAILATMSGLAFLTGRRTEVVNASPA